MARITTRVSRIMMLSLFYFLAASFLSGRELPDAAGAAGSGAGVFVDSGQALGDASSFDVALGDLDGDGDLDAFVANAEDTPDEVWINQGGAQGSAAGVFLDSGQSLGALSSVAVALADLDGDGDLDAFAIANPSAGDALQIWINQGGAQGGNASVFLHNGQMIGYAASRAVALGDLDGDGDLDAFVVRGAGTADHVWWNDGAGNFTESGQNLGSDYGSDVALGDLDGDGDLDAFVANDGANKVWINQGGAQGGAEGQFADSGQSLGGARSQAVALADLDGDGDLDAIVANSGFDSQYSLNWVWINQGGAQGGTPGQFAGSELGLEPGQSFDVALADLDGDGDPDAFIAKYGANEVWLNGSGAIVDSGQRLGNDVSVGIALGDVDGDGDQDAFVANVWRSGNRVYLNRGAPPQEGADADLSVTVSGIPYIDLDGPPQAYFFVVTVSNLGPNPATEVLAKAVQGEGGGFDDGDQGYCLTRNFGCQAWFFGDLAPGQSATIIYNKDREAFYDEEGMIRYFAPVHVTVTGAEFDPDPSNNRAQSITYFYDCDSASCSVEEGFCRARIPSFEGTVGAVHASSQSTSLVETRQSLMIWSDLSPLRGLLRPLEEAIIDLAVYYLVRDQVLMSTADGQHYVDLYYTHDPEINSLLEADPVLEAEGIATMQLWEPNLWALVMGEGDSATITDQQVTAIDDYLTHLSAVASPELQQVIAKERARLGSPEDYVGMTMAEARGHIVGYAVNLPFVTKRSVS